MRVRLREREIRERLERERDSREGERDVFTERKT